MQEVQDPCKNLNATFLLLAANCARCLQESCMECDKGLALIPFRDRSRNFRRGRRVVQQPFPQKLELHEAHVPRANINVTNAHVAENVCTLRPHEVSCPLVLGYPVRKCLSLWDSLQM